MSDVEVTRIRELATVALNRGKVNALNDALVRELSNRFDEQLSNDAVRAVVLTGKGKFFSFGFDIPYFLQYSKEAFVEFLSAFTSFYTKLYEFPKPVVAALNGHAIAGGCMIATACDYRVMASGKGKISLNEVTFGSSVFAGSVEMLRACVGQRNAEAILYSGAMYGAEEALGLGLVDQVVAAEELIEVAQEKAGSLARHDPSAFKSIKALARGPVAVAMRSREAASIREFADIWYSETTWEQLERIRIRE